MNSYKRIVVVLNLVLVLALLGWSVVKKERTLRKGRLVLLELAPVDPRSLMQGDYMVLNYAISSAEDIGEDRKTGYFIVKTDAENVAHKVRIQRGRKPLQAGEIAIRYTLADYRNVNIGAGSYFFEEGKAGKFARAKYGGLKIDGKGECILVGLYDDKRRLLRP